MPVANFPAQLQSIIQQNFLDREFQNGLQARLGFRAVADKEVFRSGIGETITKTRRGLKAPVTTPLSPISNSNFDNGLTPSGWPVEQYTVSLNQYGDTIDLNMVTEQVGIANQFLQNAYVNGQQAMTTMDNLARNALFGGTTPSTGGYLGGNTRVRTALGAAGATTAVDDIRGFFTVLLYGAPTPVSTANPLAVTVNGNPYSVIAVTPDGTNVSTAPGGISGTLTFSGNVAQGDGALNAPVISVTAPLVVRPFARASTAALQPGDTLTMQEILAGVARLRANNVPMMEGGLYHMYLDDQQMLGLYSDPAFQTLYRGAYQSAAFMTANIVELLGVRFITTTQAPQQASLGAGAVHRGIILGQGALIEASFDGMGHSDIGGVDPDLRRLIDGVLMITREPLDRLAQIIAQSWYWIGGYALPTDATTTAATVPTASSAILKRGIVCESL